MKAINEEPIQRWTNLSRNLLTALLLFLLTACELGGLSSGRVEEAPPPLGLKFAIDLLFRSSQVMVPVITGFIVLVSAIVGKLRDSSGGPIDYRLVGAAIGFSIVALFGWLFVQPFCYKAALGIDQYVWGGWFPGGLYTPADLFALGRKFAFVGQAAFIIAVVFACWFCLQMARRSDRFN